MGLSYRFRCLFHYHYGSKHGSRHGKHTEKVVESYSLIFRQRDRDIEIEIEIEIDR